MKAPIILIVIVVSILIGMDGLYVVNEAEQAIITQFGRFLLAWMASTWLTKRSRRSSPSSASR
ncbi:MAG: hypothetical protein JRC99_13390 [Deltaproteobacteria bacterium]|nr:hypothetical protein [Deltaproteobacteria bacterium]